MVFLNVAGDQELQAQNDRSSQLPPVGPIRDPFRLLPEGADEDDGGDARPYDDDHNADRFDRVAGERNDFVELHAAFRILEPEYSASAASPRSSFLRV